MKKDEKRLRDKDKDDINLEKVSKLDMHRGETRSARSVSGTTGGENKVVNGVVGQFAKKQELKHAEEILKSKMYRWRFPCIRNELQKVPQTVKDALDYGIGIYTSDMPTHVKYMIFNMFKEGTIKLLISDTSIAHGINLPIRTVVLLGSPDSYTPEVFRQISGRAGRFGYDTCGYVVSLFDTEQQKKCYNTDQITTQLTIPRLMNYYELIRLHVNNPEWNSYLKFDVRKQMIELYLNYISEFVSSEVENVNGQIKLIEDKHLRQHQFTGMNQMMRDDRCLILTELLSTVETSLILRKMDMRSLLNVLNYILCGCKNSIGNEDIHKRIKEVIDTQFELFGLQREIEDEKDNLIDAELLINMVYDKPELLKTITHMNVIKHLQYMFRWIMTIKKYLQSIISKERQECDLFYQNIRKIDERLYYSCVKYSI